MEHAYDNDADAIYIEFRKGEFAKNKKMDDFTILDLDGEGNILGIVHMLPMKIFISEYLHPRYEESVP